MTELLFFFYYLLNFLTVLFFAFIFTLFIEKRNYCSILIKHFVFFIKIRYSQMQTNGDFYLILTIVYLTNFKVTKIAKM
jgi:hypothetical protein